MNKAGVSSACYYPLETEKSFDKICSAGYKAAELFFNSPSELSKEFINGIDEKRKNAGVDIVSFHPYMSFAESFFLFSSYERRFHDILPLYERFFEAMQQLDSKIFVIHGSKKPGSVTDEVYCERFKALIDMAQPYGVSVCQENIVYYRSETPEYLMKMRSLIGDSFGIVLDIKQARRTKLNPYDFVNALGDSIKHVHISDYSAEKDCIPPLEGKFDFSEFFSTMRSNGYKGSYIIELYDHSYSDESQITRSYEKISNLLLE